MRKNTKGVRVRSLRTGQIFVFRTWQLVNGVPCYANGVPVNLESQGAFVLA